MKPYEFVTPNFKPEPQSLTLLQSIQAAGFVNPVLFGGALRDDYYRNVLHEAVPTNDYDIKAAIDPVIFEDARCFDAATPKLTHYIMTHFPGSHIDQVGVNFDAQGHFAAAGAEFVNGNGQRVHLILTSAMPEKMEDWIFGDAPINRIAMNAEGRVLADKNFEHHARLRVYQPDEPISKQWLPYHPGLEKLREKIPGMRYVPPGQSPDADGGFVDRCATRNAGSIER